jgi:hypothetical protein
MNARRQILQAGESLVQPDLAATLARVREGADLGGGDNAPVWANAAATPLAGDKLFALPDNGQARNGADGRTGATGFVVRDADGSVVLCGLSLGRAFGGGVMARGQGFFMPAEASASGRAAGGLLLDSAGKRVISALAAGGGHAVEEAAVALRAMANNRTPTAIAADRRMRPDDGTRINIVSCARNEETAAGACEAQADPHGAGYAVVLAPEGR